MSVPMAPLPRPTPDSRRATGPRRRSGHCRACERGCYTFRSEFTSSSVEEVGREERADPMTMPETTPQAFPQSAPPPAVEQLVSMTDAAAAKVQELRTREGKTDARLRLFVKAGGCSGFSYGLAFDDRLADDDKNEDHGGGPGVLHALSAQYVDGAAVCYVGSLMGSGLAVHKPHAV